MPRTPGASQHSLSLGMLDGIISTQDLNRSELLMNESKSINELTAAVDGVGLSARAEGIAFQL